MLNLADRLMRNNMLIIAESMRVYGGRGDSIISVAL